jgi:hypothetical protein
MKTIEEPFGPLYPLSMAKADRQASLASRSENSKRRKAAELKELEHENEQKIPTRILCAFAAVSLLSLNGLTS